MKINEILEYQIVDFATLTENISTKNKKTTLKIADGNLWTSPHFDQRKKERLDKNKKHSFQDFKNMVQKFARDPISESLKNLEAENPNSDFCLFNEDNLGVAISKTELPFRGKFEIAYLVNTVSESLFPYSNQTLYMVPKTGPCRIFTPEDFKIFTPQQMRAFTPQGRSGR